MKDFKNLEANLKTSFENLPKTSENFNVVSEQVAQLLAQIANLAETQESLRQDVNLVLNAEKEHPVLVPNKGGRPRNEKT